MKHQTYSLMNDYSGSHDAIAMNKWRRYGNKQHQIVKGRHQTAFYGICVCMKVNH